MFDNLREDLHRYGASPYQQLKALLTSPGAWAIVGYRFARWVHTNRVPQPFHWLLKLASAVVYIWVNVATNIQLPVDAVIKPGLFIAHTGYIVLAPGVVIGRHCTLTPGVIIGHAAGGRHSLDQSPVIGDRVYLGPGAGVIGPVTVGDDALVGVNAVVTNSIPARGIATGNPARVVSLRGSFDLIEYPGMASDAARSASLAAAKVSSDAAAGISVITNQDNSTIDVQDSPASDRRQDRIGNSLQCNN